VTRATLFLNSMGRSS